MTRTFKQGKIVFMLPIVFFLALIFSFVPTKPELPNPQREAIMLQTILDGIQKMHFRPKELNDNFSKDVFQLYVQRMDYRKRFLMLPEYQKLKMYETQLDDQVNASDFTFFNESMDLITRAIERSRAYYPEILGKPFDFSRNEEIELEGKKREFVRNEKELKEYWYQMLKYETLLRLTDKLEEQEKNKGKEGYQEKSLAELEKESREAIKKRYDDTYKNLSKLTRSDRLSDYLNAILNVYDPHTGYFDPKDKQDFDINMSGTLEGIGARLQTDGDYTKVTEIIPGGPAWKQKELKPNDLILKVNQENAEPIDIMGWRIDDVVKQIRGKKGTKVTLNVKKVDGSIQDITIERDVVIIDESNARSAVLNLDGVLNNVGYIYLPKFYVDFERPDGRNCSDDVAREIEKLKARNVNGIILDLRNNGGGSLRDVVKMTGFFFEQGPVVQVKTRNMNPEVLNDEDPAVQYNGPLIVMVNEFSASASEIMAAALQDYKRAIVVGSPTTYGKGTVQRFFSLDRYVRGNDEFKPLGDVKLTIQKFYRVNGGSTQLKGVTPDIILPDPYEYVETGEKENDYPMEWSEIAPVGFGQNTYKVPNLERLKQLHEMRMEKDEQFRLVEENALKLKAQKDVSAYPLNLEKFRAQEKALNTANEKYKKIYEKEVAGLRPENLEVDLPFIQSDTSRMARNDDWLKNMRKDFYLAETIQILRDMRELK